MKTLVTTIVLVLALTTSGISGGGGDILRGSVMVDKLEYQFHNDKALSWDTYAFIGYDINKIYIYSEGEKVKGESAESDNQLVYSRAIAPYWDLQLGVGYDKVSGAHQSWAVLGIQGLAPYFFETRAVLLIGKSGTLGIRAEVEYEALLTQKLVLTPSLAMEAYSKDVPEMGMGSGFSNLTLGARLRYEFVREFAPYVGVEWSQNFSNTDRFIPLNEIYVIAGLRFWF